MHKRPVSEAQRAVSSFGEKSRFRLFPGNRKIGRARRRILLLRIIKRQTRVRIPPGPHLRASSLAVKRLT